MASAVYDRAWGCARRSGGTETDSRGLSASIRARAFDPHSVVQDCRWKVHYLVKGAAPRTRPLTNTHLLPARSRFAHRRLPERARLSLGDSRPHALSKGITSTSSSRREGLRLRGGDGRSSATAPPPPATNGTPARRRVAALIERFKAGPPATAVDARLANTLLRQADGDVKKVADESRREPR